MYSVHQPWDPLRVCVVGRSYPPEFYAWIKVPHVRSLFERIAQETEEDFQNIIAKLQSFGVKVLRPDVFDAGTDQHDKFLIPPMTPRDTMIMIGDTFYKNFSSSLPTSYQNVRDSNWPDCASWAQFDQLPTVIKRECSQNFGFDQLRRMDYMQIQYQSIIDDIQQQGNTIKHSHDFINGAKLSRIGRDLYFGTDDYSADQSQIKQLVDQEFPNYRTHIVNTGGHSDGTYCPVRPGLIVSLRDIPTYADTYPGWEVVYLQNQSWDSVKPFLDLKQKNQGRWWIPGFEYDTDVINVVETWLGQWLGYVEETVFDVNMLVIDPKNVMVFNYNKTVFDAFERHGITPHVVPFRHRYFWDGGIHCVTLDLDRQGHQDDLFPDRQ
jgi:glycine amidinotransferase